MRAEPAAQLEATRARRSAGTKVVVAIVAPGTIEDLVEAEES